MNKFPSGSRVCFIGDSITHNNLHLAHIVTFYREHFHDAKVEFYNCGISGGTLTTTLKFFDEDILCYNPTHAVIMIGINDSARWALPFEGERKYQIIKEAFQNYKSNLSKLCDKLENMGVSNIITFDAHDPRVQNAIPLSGFENVRSSYQMIKALLKTAQGDIKTGIQIVLKALEEPIRQIAKNLLANLEKRMQTLEINMTFDDSVVDFITEGALVIKYC